MKEKSIINNVAQYYNEKLEQHGASAKGVDWNSTESQEIRFDQLLKIIKGDKEFSLLDYGCGFGSVLSYIKKSLNGDFKFCGFDISEKMIKKAKELNKDSINHSWTTKIEPNKKFDYLISSGIFNVQLEHNDADWESYILKTLHNFNDITTKGFSFNMLTKYSDKEYMRDYLYYADPLFLFDYCKRNFSNHVAILHDYPLYEFTLIVRKDI